ncbi:Gfo/Idh/MocA family oxidoreductase [Aliiglaciecola litoralis]|uniref:Gfo/Idh/MocA family oxidoreductase n=1 Tax=Aliiglaciecola litoralis TaxID=582857 RepID=A0ABP3WUL0_9ALTE
MIRWGMIGCGDVTERKSAPAYQQTSGFKLVAVSARTPGKSQNYATRHKVPKYYLDAHSLIHDPDIDAVYIATPPDSHLALALMVAAANKICCIEKPMAVNANQSRQIEQAFSSRRLPLFIAYYRRSLPGFVAVKQRIDAGEIGALRHIHWHYSRAPSQLDINRQPNWRTEKEIAPGGYFDDIGSHGLDIMTYFAGKVSRASGICSNQQGYYSAYDAVIANMQFESGATASGSWNFASHLYLDEMRILGSKGSIVLSVFGPQAALITTALAEYHIEMPKPDPIQRHFVQAMADHLLAGTPHPSQGKSALHTSWLMDQILGTDS